jgi:hypothetical protein
MVYFVHVLYFELLFSKELDLISTPISNFMGFSLLTSDY